LVWMDRWASRGGLSSHHADEREFLCGG
jgi:hypothetical protein